MNNSEERNEFEGAVPILKVRDLAASMDYYVNKRGFEKRWDAGALPGFGAARSRSFSVRERRDALACGRPSASDERRNDRAKDDG